MFFIASPFLFDIHSMGLFYSIFVSSLGVAFYTVARQPKISARTELFGAKCEHRRLENYCFIQKYNFKACFFGG